MEKIEPRVKQATVPLSVYLGWLDLTVEERIEMEDTYFRKYFWNIAPDCKGMKLSMARQYEALIDSYLESYKRKGGRIGAPKGNSNARKNNSETIKTIQNNQNNNCFSENNSKTIQNNKTICSQEKEKEYENKKEYEDVEEECRESNGTSTATAAAKKDFSYSIGKVEFDPTGLLMEFWNFYAERSLFIKKIECPTANLKQLVTDRYNELLADCHNDPLEAKNMMAKAIENVATSAWFANNPGKANATWVFKNADNFSKTLNGNFND